jgi:hypothetical protein
MLYIAVQYVYYMSEMKDLFYACMYSFVAS